MPRFSAEQIYSFARQAGFSPDEAATMTAIALAESGGRSDAHNPVGEDSRGLWQINARAHKKLAEDLNLFDPVQNAKAAFAVSRQGADITPWTVTHGGMSARYLRFKQEAQDAAIAFGDGPGRGVWTGTAGYNGPEVPAGPSGGGGSSEPLTGGSQGGSAALERFLEVARAQAGDTYVFGAETKLGDSDPDTFDCSELTQWAAHQAGVKIPDGATAQYLHLKERGMLIPVEEARNTPGALLFSFDREPRPGDGRTPGAHVAISLGDGKTIEARGRAFGVGEFEVGKRFEFAAVIPGISDGTATPLAPANSPVPAFAPLTAAPPPQMGGPDTDRDGLTDAMEQRRGLNPLAADSDGDNLADGFEIATSRSDPSKADTDGDRLDDAFELARGLDPTSPDSDSDGHLDGSLPTDWRDTDADGLDDALETALGLDPNQVDSDGDGYVDALERQASSDPLSAAVTPLRSGDPFSPAPLSQPDPLT
ncbi:C40 family peptidase [Micromonospora sp. CPCC 205371]|nr:C40 family peptidase [Micromonospora sp. CPCC 205371]